jgi:hypothetical protein
METTLNLTENRKLIVSYDEWADSPRTWDNLTKMIFFGKHKHLGDKHNINPDNYNGWDKLEEAIKKEYDVILIQKVYAYSHGGLTISTSPFSCPWDSGTLGFVIITKQDIKQNYGWKVITKKRLDEVSNSLDRIIESEIEVLDNYIQGEVFSFQIQDEAGEIEDSCCGFYGSDIKVNGILDYISNEDKSLVLEQI